MPQKYRRRTTKSFDTVMDVQPGEWSDFLLYLRRQNKALLRSMRNHGHRVCMIGPRRLNRRLYGDWGW